MNNENNENMIIDEVSETLDTNVAPAPQEPVAPAPVAPVAPVTPVTPQAPVAPVAPTPSTPVTPTVNTEVKEPVITLNTAVDGIEPPLASENKDEVNNEKKPVNKKMIIYLCLIVVLGAIFAYVMFGKKSPKPLSTTPAPVVTPMPNQEAVLEDVKISGSTCVNSQCSILIGDTDNLTTYKYEAKNSELFTKLGSYTDYIKVNIYYNNNGVSQSIVDYKIFNKETNEDITSITTEAELREKIGLFAVGTHTETLTLTKVGLTGVGEDDNGSYSYETYAFTDSNNHTYDMKYINASKKADVKEGNKYKVTFEVKEGTLEYDYIIKSIEKVS